MSNNLRCYSELVKMKTFEERFEYLKLGGSVGDATFGFDRHINQMFYHYPEWKRVRREVIIRDNACDLGIEGRDIVGRGMLIIHHMNPITKEQILDRDPSILDPEYLITVLRTPTHEAIHYGDSSILLGVDIIDRQAGDTKLW